ncbi:hypothetical protein [Rhizobium sp. SAFR-030]|uniref:hypothetical protein n=1 Tax=Rhizobium sp. SAFR-030 TaxID=3387277 RepID=UPI003F80D6B2
MAELLAFLADGHNWLFVGDFLPRTDNRFHRVAVLIKAALEDMLDPTSPHMVKLAFFAAATALCLLSL